MKICICSFARWRTPNEQVVERKKKLNPKKIYLVKPIMKPAWPRRVSAVSLCLCLWHINIIMLKYYYALDQTECARARTLAYG